MQPHTIEPSEEQPDSALITGAARGIGRATALCLANAGYRLSLLDVLPAELDTLKAEIEHSGGVAAVHACSVTDAEGLAEAFARHVAQFGKLEALVNCAGIGLFAAVEATSSEQWRQMLEINLTGTFLTCQAALPHLRAQGSGHIVNVISIAGKQAFPQQSAYCASKWGALGFTRVLAQEVRAAGIRVTALCPGAVNTPFWNTLGQTFDRSRMLQPQDVAETIRFLLAQSAAVMTDEMEIMPASGIL